MMWLTGLSDFLLYITVSFLAGIVVFQFVPEARKPVTRISDKAVVFAVLSMPLLTAAPIMQLVLFLADSRPFITAVGEVLTGFRSGNVYMAGVAITLFWLIALWLKAHRGIFTMLLVLTIVNIGYGSHAASIAGLTGFSSHTVHLLALSLWAGVLLQVAWFRGTDEHWERFTKWFTPFAMVMVAILLVSGVLVMLLFVKPADYVDSWILPYGQLLLLKHLSIIPLFAAAWINSRRSGTLGPDDKWLKIESIALLTVFFLTSFMSKLAPPHDINQTFRREGTAPFSEWLSGAAYIHVRAAFTLSVEGLLMIAIGLCCFFLAFFFARKSRLMWLLLLLITGFVLFLYAGLMMNLRF